MIVVQKEILYSDFQDVVDFDLKYMVQESALASKEAPPPLTLQELVTAENKGDELYWLMSEEGERAGYYWLERRAGCLFLSAVVISTTFRNQKIGRQVLKWMDEKALRDGLSSCGLAVGPSNLPALHLYLSHGYQVVRCHPDYFGSSNPGDPGKFRLVLEKKIPVESMKAVSKKVLVSCEDYTELMNVVSQGYVGVSLASESRIQFFLFAS